MSAPNTGDKILFVVKGPFGTGLVVGTVQRVAASRNSIFIASTSENSFILASHTEGLRWMRGDDPDTPEAHALLVAAVLALA